MITFIVGALTLFVLQCTDVLVFNLKEPFRPDFVSSMKCHVSNHTSGVFVNNVSRKEDSDVFFLRIKPSAVVRLPFECIAREAESSLFSGLQNGFSDFVCSVVCIWQNISAKTGVRQVLVNIEDGTHNCAVAFSCVCKYIVNFNRVATFDARTICISQDNLGSVGSEERYLSEFSSLFSSGSSALRKLQSVFSFDSLAFAGDGCFIHKSPGLNNEPVGSKCEDSGKSDQPPFARRLVLFLVLGNLGFCVSGWDECNIKGRRRLFEIVGGVIYMAGVFLFLATQFPSTWGWWL